MSRVKLVSKKGSTLHDFPYRGPERKCPHFWIINVTPPGPAHCIHGCVYCYARQAVYADYSAETRLYNNLPELVERDLRKISLCPPVSISNVSDPCQPIPELRAEVRRLVQLLMDYGVSFAVTTKGDPGFLLDVPGFAGYRPKFVGITIEGTAEVLDLLSPSAPSFDQRVEAVSRLSGAGVETLVRLDPVFIHLFQARHGDGWSGRIERLVETFRAAGAKHIVSSTGRLPSSRTLAGGTGIRQTLSGRIERISPDAARRFESDYRYERTGTGQGYLLRKDLRLEFHRWLRGVVEKNGMTYAACQELSAAESDSVGLAHCERFRLPFAAKQEDGRFRPVDGCTANCHVSCRDRSHPPCGRPELVTARPYKTSYLKGPARPRNRLPGMI